MIPSFSIMGISLDFENMARKIQEVAEKQIINAEVQQMAVELENICQQSYTELTIEYNILKKTIS
jgi:hypothetical protein